MKDKFAKSKWYYFKYYIKCHTEIFSETIINNLPRTKYKAGRTDFSNKLICSLVSVTMCFWNLWLVETVKADTLITQTLNFAESSNQAQTQTVNIPGIYSIDSATASSGSVTSNRTGSDVIFNLSGGTSTRNVYTPYSISASNYLSNTTNTFATTNPYSDGSGFSGTLNASGSSYITNSVTDTYSKSVSTSQSSWSNTLPSSVAYNDGSYAGTMMGLGVTSVSTQTGGTYTASDTIYVTGQPSASYSTGGYTGTLTQYVSSGAYTASDTKYVTAQASASYNSGGYVGTLSQYLVSGAYTASDTKYVTAQPSATYNTGGYVGTLSQYLVSGAYTASDTKYVTAQSSASYNSGGYVGTLTQYQTGGTYTAPYYDSKYIRPLLTGTTLWSDSDGAGVPNSYSYNDGIYSGTLQCSTITMVSWQTVSNGMLCTWESYFFGTVSGTVPASDTRTYAYQGNVTRPASDTRVYAYQGNVTKPASDTRVYAYQGNVTKPASDTRTYAYQGYVTKPASDTRTYAPYYSQNYSGTAYMYIITNTYRQDYSGTAYKSHYDYYYTYSVTLKYYVDVTSPTVTFSKNSVTSTSILANTSGSDGGSGLSSTPFRFTTDGLSTSWLSSSSTYNFTGLGINTTHTLKMEAIDVAGNIGSSTLSLCTNVATPIVTNSDITSISATVGVGGGNPVYTNYSLKLKDALGAITYVDSSGVLQATVTQYNIPTGLFTIKALNPLSGYTLEVTAYNMDGTNTAISSPLIFSTLHDVTSPTIAFTASKSRTGQLIIIDSNPNTTTYLIDLFDGTIHKYLNSSTLVWGNTANYMTLPTKTLTIGDLYPSSNYTLTVTAKSSLANVAVSNVLTFTTDATSIIINSSGTLEHGIFD